MNEFQNTLQSIAVTVKEQRKLRNRTQADLAAMVKCSTAHTSHIENMHADAVSIKIIYALGEVFEIPCADIFNPIESIIHRENEYLREQLREANRHITHFMKMLEIRLKNREAK